MPEIVQRLSDFLNYFGAWFDQYISSGLTGFIKAICILFIKILEFFIEVIKWIMTYL